MSLKNEPEPGVAGAAAACPNQCASCHEDLAHWARGISPGAFALSTLDSTGSFVVAPELGLCYNRYRKVHRPIMNELRLLHDTCKAVAAQLMARHDWALLDAAEFGNRLHARVQAAAPSADPADSTALIKVATDLYCEVWYEACSAAGERRVQAYSELARYLYDRALYKVHDVDVAREITHDAILLVAEQLPNCHNPGAFMAFALLKLWNASTAYFRTRDLHARHTDPVRLEPDDDQELELPDTSVVTPEDAAVRTELTANVLARFNALMQESPRAQKQLLAVLLKFFHGLSDEEIARELATDVPSVHVLRSRGLKRLREDAALQALFVTMTRG